MPVATRHPGADISKMAPEHLRVAFALNAMLCQHGIDAHSTDRVSGLKRASLFIALVHLFALLLFRYRQFY